MVFELFRRQRSGDIFHGLIICLIDAASHKNYATKIQKEIIIRREID